MNAQSWSAVDYGHHAPFVAELGKAVIELLDVRAPARVLDLGCGDGALTRELMQRGYDVLGVDASEVMVGAARARGVDAQRVDGHELSFVEDFEAVFSNATLHWLTRPDDVLRGVYRALRPGGRFVAEFGGAGNVARVVDALLSGLARRGLEGSTPWYFPSAGEYAGRLERAGFHVDWIAHFDRPTPLPTDVRGWIATFGDSFTGKLPAAQRERYLDEVHDELAPSLLRDGVWVLDYVRLRLHATKRHL